MKSMREATMSSGMLDNAGTKLGTEMLDTQFATKMTGLPGGLGRRRSRASSSARWAAAPRPASPAPAAAGRGRRSPTPPPARRCRCRSARPTSSQPHRGRARAGRGADRHPRGLHGRRRRRTNRAGAGSEITQRRRQPSHNLFGIKAGAGWNGPVAEVTTTEYVDGEAAEGDGEVPRLRVATTSRSATTRG